MKVTIESVELGTISKGQVYWEFTPVGSTTPSLRAHGIFSLKSQLRRWLGDRVQFGYYY
jgi:hypothetical protein